jgi:hypothetical protein
VDILLRKRHDSALKRSRIRYTQERRRKASRSLSGPAVCAVGVCAWKWCNAGRAGPDTYLDYVDASHWRERMGVDLCVLPPCPANPRYPRCTTYIYKMRQQASKPHAGDVILGPTKGTYVSTCLLLMGSTRLHSGLAKGLFGFHELKLNSHHINVFSNAWSTKCRLIACMSAQIRSDLRDESIYPN